MLEESLAAGRDEDTEKARAEMTMSCRACPWDAMHCCGLLLTAFVVDCENLFKTMSCVALLAAMSRSCLYRELR